MANSILKPHYRLLGMLLERQELSAELYDLSFQNPLSLNEQVFNTLHDQLEAVDRDINEYYGYVVETFTSSGRTIHDLEAFIGSTLNVELFAALDRFTVPMP